MSKNTIIFTVYVVSEKCYKKSTTKITAMSNIAVELITVF
jgi:hypothetical protein